MSDSTGESASTESEGQNAGEAESILVAEQFEGKFITDDGPAYDFAEKRWRLKNATVFDSVDLLRDAVQMGELLNTESAEIAGQIQATGRHLRRVHDGRVESASYFLPQ